MLQISHQIEYYLRYLNVYVQFELFTCYVCICLDNLYCCLYVCNSLIGPLNFLFNSASTLVVINTAKILCYDSLTKLNYVQLKIKL